MYYIDIGMITWINKGNEMAKIRTSKTTRNNPIHATWNSFFNRDMNMFSRGDTIRFKYLIYEVEEKKWADIEIVRAELIQ